MKVSKNYIKIIPFLGSFSLFAQGPPPPPPPPGLPIDGELFIRNLHIPEYALGTYYNHEAKRVRKLLLKKEELNKLIRKTAEKGFTIVPYRIYTTERGFIKLEIALAQGKKSFDKRETLKERDSKRDLDRIKKAYK